MVKYCKLAKRTEPFSLSSRLSFSDGPANPAGSPALPVQSLNVMAYRRLKIPVQDDDFIPAPISVSRRAMTFFSVAALVSLLGESA
jgi:hypothetical protein